VTLLRRHLSPAMVISLVALFVSLGGVSYGIATGLIDSREIKDNTVRTRDLRNNDVRTRDLRNNEVRGLDIRNSTVRGRDVGLNTLTGDDVDESQLEKVPSATSADSATSAQTAESAESLNAVRVVPIKHRSGNATGQTVLDAGGLQLVVTCAGGSEDVRARTTVAGSEIAVVSVGAPAAGGTAAQVVHNSDDSFHPGDDFALQGTASASDDRIYQVHYLAGNGADVTAQLSTEDDVGASNCVVSGYAVVG
jgi:hypothetical protein